MIYTCIAGGIRSPPAFFLKNKYKEPMKMQNENTDNEKSNHERISQCN